MEKEKLSELIEDMKIIQDDVSSMCEIIKSSPLTKSTKNLIDVLESISILLKETIQKE